MSTEIEWRIPMSYNTESGKIAVIYARYSSHSQGEQSIEGQLSKAHAYAAAKGYTVAHEYVDRAKTGRTDNREEFQRMLKDTAKKQFDVVILWKVDRFGRNREEIALNKIKCKKNNVRVEYVAENIPNSPEGVILESVLEGFAEYYSLQLSQNIRRGQVESAKKCQSTGGNRPLGYRTGKDKKFEIDPDTAPTVRKIFEWYAKGMTVTEIVEQLNSAGLRTLRGSEFTKNSLHTILKNEKYTGVYIYKDSRVEGGMPRIVDDETFWKVQEMLKINKRAPAHKWSRADYLLTDKLFCGKCGAGMVGESGTSKTGVKHNYYICINHKRKEKTCDKRAVRQAVIEDLVIDATVELLQDDAAIEFIIDETWNYYLEQDEGREEIEELKRQLQQVDTATGNLIRAIEAGLLNDATKKRMEELQDQKRELEAATAEAEIARNFQITKEYIRFFFYGLREMDYTTPACQKRLIKTFINSVYVFDDHLLINYNCSSDSKTIALVDVEKVETEGGEGFGRCARCSTT